MVTGDSALNTPFFPIWTILDNFGQLSGKKPRNILIKTDHFTLNVQNFPEKTDCWSNSRKFTRNPRIYPRGLARILMIINSVHHIILLLMLFFGKNGKKMCTFCQKSETDRLGPAWGPPGQIWTTLVKNGQFVKNTNPVQTIFMQYIFL